jgi:hypothetical protein
MIYTVMESYRSRGLGPYAYLRAMNTYRNHRRWPFVIVSPDPRFRRFTMEVLVSFNTL